MAANKSLNLCFPCRSCRGSSPKSLLLTTTTLRQSFFKLVTLQAFSVSLCASFSMSFSTSLSMTFTASLSEAIVAFLVPLSASFSTAFIASFPVASLVTSFDKTTMASHFDRNVFERLSSPTRKAIFKSAF